MCRRESGDAAQPVARAAWMMGVTIGPMRFVLLMAVTVYPALMLDA